MTARAAAAMEKLGAKRGERLSRHTFVQVGGPADWFLPVRERAAFTSAIRTARCAGLPLTVLGAGSNVLIKDGGLRGLVVKNQAAGCRSVGEHQIEVDAGTRFAALARATARKGLSGMEWAAGIPGAIGGGLPTNAGAYGAQLADVIVSAAAVAPSGEQVELSRAQLDLTYRSSALRRGGLHDHLITAVTLQLQPADPAQCQAEIDRVEALRKANAPSGPSLGSTFKNPPNDDRTAGQLIDQAALKGSRRGAAQVSDLHANYLLNVNVGRARAADFLQLIQHIQARVRDRFGISLELEIAVLGAEEGETQ